MNQSYRLQRFVCLVSVLALLAGATPTFAVTVEEIPSPRPNGWSVDLTGTIPADTLRQIDRLGDEVKAANGGEIAVVVLASTGKVASRDFAVRLANHWGVGDKDKNNGILLLAALTDRGAEIVLGEGIDTSVNNRLSEEIMQGEMVPRFRAGDPGGALLEGARACARRILKVEPLPAETATPMSPLVSAETPSPLQAEAEAPTRGPAEVLPAPASSVASALGCLFALVAIVVGLIGGIYLLVRAPRCKQCRVPMKLLSEQEDDAYLGPAERTEERIGSVNHKILMCPQCGASRKKAAASLLSNYSRCSSCGTRAEQSTSCVIENPTYSSSGTRRVDTRCVHCGYQSTYTTSIPRLEQPRPATSSRSSSLSSSSRPSSSSSSSSSSRSSSSSSSSSRSSGFGGGRSSGGGASGKW